MAGVNPTFQRAVVIGAGMGGLTAAQALAGHFEQVIVLEREDLPPGPIPERCWRA